MKLITKRNQAKLSFVKCGSFSALISQSHYCPLWLGLEVCKLLFPGAFGSWLPVKFGQTGRKINIWEEGMSLFLSLSISISPPTLHSSLPSSDSVSYLIPAPEAVVHSLWPTWCRGNPTTSLLSSSPNLWIIFIPPFFFWFSDIFLLAMPYTKYPVLEIPKLLSFFPD